MAGDNKIKISADVSAIKKSLLDVSKEVKNLGKSKVAIFDQNQKNFLEREAKKHLSDIRQEMEKNNKKMLLATKLLNKEGRSLKEQMQTRKKMTAIIKEQVKLQKDAAKLQDVSSSMAAKPGSGGIMSRIRGMMPGGMGMGSLLKGGALGLALGVGGFAVGRARAANNTFNTGINDRLALRGRGVGDMTLNDREGAAAVGLNSQSMRRSRLASMDIFGEAGSTQQAVMQRAAFERNFGLQQGTSRNIGSQLRGTLGGSGAQEATMQIQASLIASGITDEIGPYLETAANMLSEINEKGITFSGAAMGLLAQLASQDGVSAERAGRLATGIDSAIRGSSGESNAFFQQVFSRAGIGGGTLGGIQAAIRSGGFFGANTNADALISGSDKAMFQRTGIGGNNMQSIAQNTLGQLDQLFAPGENDNQTQKDNKRLQRLDFVRRTFGLSSEVEAANVEQLLQQAASGQKSEDEVRKEFTKIQSGNSELGNLQAINKSTEASVQILKDIRSSVLDETGEQLAPLFRTIDKTMMKLDATLSAMMSFFGIDAPDAAAKEGLTGSSSMTADELEQYTAGDSTSQKNFKEELKANYNANEKMIEDLKKNATSDGRLLGDDHRKYQEAMAKRKNFNSTASNLGMSFEENGFLFPQGSSGGMRGNMNIASDNGMQQLLDGLTAVIKPKDKEKSKENNDQLLILKDVADNIKKGNATRERMSRKPAAALPNKTQRD
jgi:hypothetical protein